MKKSLFFLLILAASILACSFYPFGYPRPVPVQTKARFAVDTLATGLVVPWDIVFTPSGDMLFTERPGRVRCMRKGQLLSRPLLTLTDIEVKGKMGLLGMRLHPQFASNRLVYLAYNYREGNATFVRIARYILSEDSLVQPQVLIEHIPGVFNHTGCRMVFGKGNKLFITTGDADVPKEAQNLKVLNGKILRLNDDGSIPADNPFMHNDTARHEIWSYGHRNPQGIAFQPGSGYLYASEHGPTGGDEINLIAPGNNYGWPISHHRENRDGTMPPLLEFTPSIGPAEALFYSGKAFPDMKGNLLVGCMRGEAILRIAFGNNRISKYDFLFKKQFGRIRALAEGPDGYIYFSTTQVDPPESRLAQGEHGYDLLLRMRPAQGNTPEDPAHPQVTLVPGQEAMYSRTASATARSTAAKSRSIAQLYTQLCASCHGADMHGKDNIPSLTDAQWLHGGSSKAIQQSIAQGIVPKGMPAWEGVMSAREIERMAAYILQHRQPTKRKAGTF